MIVTDMMPKEKQGTVLLKGGGPYFDYVSVLMTSAKNENIDSFVEVFGLYWLTPKFWKESVKLT